MWWTIPAPLVDCCFPIAFPPLVLPAPFKGLRPRILKWGVAVMTRTISAEVTAPLMWKMAALSLVVRLTKRCYVFWYTFIFDEHSASLRTTCRLSCFWISSYKCSFKTENITDIMFITKVLNICHKNSGCHILHIKYTSIFC